MDLYCYKQSCRICLKPHSASKNIFSHIVEGCEAPVFQIISSLFKVELHTQKELPQFVCRKCLAEIESILFFKEDLLRNQNFLCSLLSGRFENPVDKKNNPVYPNLKPDYQESVSPELCNDKTVIKREINTSASATSFTTKIDKTSTLLGCSQVKIEDVKSKLNPKVKTNPTEKNHPEKEFFLQNLNLITLQDAHKLKTRRFSNRKRTKIIPASHYFEKPQLSKASIKKESKSVDVKRKQRCLSNLRTNLKIDENSSDLINRSVAFLTRYGTRKLMDTDMKLKRGKIIVKPNTIINDFEVQRLGPSKSVSRQNVCDTSLKKAPILVQNPLSPHNKTTKQNAESLKLEPVDSTSFTVENSIHYLAKSTSSLNGGHVRTNLILESMSNRFNSTDISSSKKKKSKIKTELGAGLEFNSNISPNGHINRNSVDIKLEPDVIDLHQSSTLDNYVLCGWNQFKAHSDKSLSKVHNVDMNENQELQLTSVDLNGSVPENYDIDLTTYTGKKELTCKQNVKKMQPAITRSYSCRSKSKKVVHIKNAKASCGKKVRHI